MSELSKAECDALLRLAETASVAERHEEWLNVASEVILGPLLHADAFAFASVDQRAWSGRFVMIRPDWAEESVPSGSGMPDALMNNHPMTPALAGPSAVVTRVTDLVSHRAWRNSSGYATMRELWGVTHHLGLPVSSRSGVSLGLSAFRAGSDFSDHETMIANRFHRIAQMAHRHVHYLLKEREGRPDQLVVSADVCATFRLTPREQVILALMARGLSTAHIALELRLSPRTVSKHQEHLYRKLHVGDRLAAVTKAQGAALAFGAQESNARRKEA